MSSLLVFAALAAAPVQTAANDKGQVAIILSGGRTLEQGNAILSSWAETEKLFEGIVETRPGYPRVVDSSTVDGLKPGFFVVMLGVCTATAADAGTPAHPVAALYKAIDARIYTRPIQWKDAGTDACPAPVRDWGEPEFDSVTTRAGTLTVAEFSNEPLEEAEPNPGTVSRTVVSLRAKDGTLTAFTNEESRCLSATVTADANSVTSEQACVNSTPCTTWGVSQLSVRYFVKNGKIASTITEKKVSEGGCD